MSGGGSRGRTTSPRNDLAQGAGQINALSGNENFQGRPHHRAMLSWAARQPDHTRRFAAMTAYFGLQCIEAGRSTPNTLPAIADNVAKMQGGA